MFLLPTRRRTTLLSRPLSTSIIFLALTFSSIILNAQYPATAVAVLVVSPRNPSWLWWKRQTEIDEQMIEVNEYKWGGEGDGADICKRWSHQSALVGTTIYIYGGQASTSTGQTDHMWNSNLLSLSLTSSWQISSPPIKSLSQRNPSSPNGGPPPIANGYLFASLTTPNNGAPMLYVYGGLFPDKPHVRPTEVSIWSYDTGKSPNDAWSEINPNKFKISSDTAQKQIERAAEGAGVSIPERGLGFYFGGHLDGYTTRGWTQNIPRVYLKSLLELRFPGGSEADIRSGEIGFRNVTKGSGLDKAGVPERADGVLVFVPKGKQGILIGIGGGRNETFSQLNIVDVYDLSTSTWSKQATTGPTPLYRVNPCAVVASALDGSSHNIYFYGGQNLVPYGEQKQYDDMWILTIPAFTWIGPVDVKGQPNPLGRAGHTCELLGRQMVVVGGYTGGGTLSCESPGVYVFDVTKLQWKAGFTGAEKGGNNGGGDDNPLIYHVPSAIISVIGGGPTGGATVTKPIQTPDPDSPLQTGGDTTYTYSHREPQVTITRTKDDGTIVTETVVPPKDNPGNGGGNGTDGKDDQDRKNGKGPNVGVIIGAVVGGLVAVVAVLFLALWLVYKKKIRRIREMRLAQLQAEQARVGGGGMVEVAGTGGRWSSGGGGGGGNRESVGQTSTVAGSGVERKSTDELLMENGEPSFWGVLLSPRRSLRVVNS